jgi:hypothetical protein
MTDVPDIRDDLEPGTPADVVALANRLAASRPLPSPGFRGELGRSLAARSRRRLTPGRLRGLAVVYASSGTALLVISALGAAGMGPIH